MQESLKATCSLELSVLIGIYFTFMFTVVFFQVELFDSVSSTQNLAHNTQLAMEFQSGSLAVTISSLAMRICSCIKVTSTCL